MFHLTTALDAASAVPLYEQLYDSLAEEMRTGAIPAGTRMPGKRRLAAELSVSVNTVDAAYQLLAAEGYLESRERSGFYVQEYLALPVRPETLPAAPARCPRRPSWSGPSAMISPRGGGPGALPVPNMGAAPKGAALFLAGAADPRRRAGRSRTAAGAGRLPRRVPGRAVQRGTDRGGSWIGIPAGAAGPVAARCGGGGKPRLPPRQAGAGKTTACPAAACLWTRTACPSRH